jgi:GrpB-like predicted nucleotidyltransferase (UPF0157 family)
MREPIEIQPYDAGWPALFGVQRTRLENALHPWLVGPVEHIGSTAVPGLAAKPIIDMLARIENYRIGAHVLPALHRIGWMQAPEPADEAGRKWSVCFPSIGNRSHHLHIYEADDPVVPGLLGFRDHLRSHPAEAAEYARLKAELAAADAHDRPRYRRGKAPFIEGVIGRLSS